MGCEHMKCETDMRKLGRGEEKEVKRKIKDHKKMRDDNQQSPVTHSSESHLWLTLFVILAWHHQIQSPDFHSLLLFQLTNAMQFINVKKAERNF